MPVARGSERLIPISRQEFPGHAYAEQFLSVVPGVNNAGFAMALVNNSAVTSAAAGHITVIGSGEQADAAPRHVGKLDIPGGEVRFCSAST